MNSNRSPEGKYKPAHSRGNTYGNQNRPSPPPQYRTGGQYPQYGSRPVQSGSQRGSTAQRAMGQGVRQGSGSHGSRRPAPPPPPKYSWIPLFTALLILLVSIGIFCTVLNSRKRAEASDRADAPADTDIYDIPSGEQNEETATAAKPIKVSYATATGRTREFGNTVTSDYAVMIERGANIIVAQKSPDTAIFPASMTKIMTLIVAYENCKDFDEKFTMTAEITDPLFLAGASVAGFAVGEEISVRDLLYGAILPSGGDATDALAIHIAGSLDAFVDMMNKKARDMGLSSTRFANPSGLHDSDHYSTPHEMAMILEYALNIEECRKILSTYQYTTAPTAQHPEGLLLTSTMFSRMKGDESGCATVLGGKTGFTNEGLHCLASFAKVGDKEYILVTAHAPATYDPIYDCINVYKNYFGEE